MTIEKPARTEKVGASGTIRVLFIIEKDGSPTFLRLTSSVEYAMDQAAIDKIESSPKWLPACKMECR